MNSFIAWIGGKSLLANRIIPMIPGHDCYCEVFAGAAWMLFKKEESQVEIINDINTDLVTLYRVVKNHLDEFVRCLRWLVEAPDEFARFREENPETLTDIQRAVRFYYLRRNGYGSKVEKPTFGISPTRAPRFNLLRIEEELSAAHIRLARVYIENLPYDKIIQRFDRKGTFFYIDPPYYGFEDYYGKGIFSRDDFDKLNTLLREIKGKFILSINDTKEVREIFKGFSQQEIRTTYTVAGGNKKKVANELTIKNFKKQGW